MRHRLTFSASFFRSGLRYELSKRTVGVVSSVILNPVGAQIAIQGHPATIGSEGLCFIERRSRCSRSVSED